MAGGAAAIIYRAMSDTQPVQQWITELSALRWPAEKARAWQDSTPWLVGANFVPSSASNQLEMWQAETFDPAAIDRELSWAAGIGMNVMRVFLHDLLWKQDAGAFLDRIDRYLDISLRHGIRTMLVLFDSCWHPFPRLGPQRPPEPGVHNSCWVQSPGARILADPRRFAGLEGYVKGVVGRFGEDPRVVIWDVWNEPDSTNARTYGPRDLGDRKAELVLPCLRDTFHWVRSAGPSQPVTCGLWHGDWTPQGIDPFGRLQVECSDIISFHCYGGLEHVQKAVGQLRPWGRPLVCSEYMARTNGSTFQAILPYFKTERIGAINWGLVSGRSQTIYPWSTWQEPCEGEPPLWFHDVFRGDGSPYSQEEASVIRALTGGPSR